MWRDARRRDACVASTTTCSRRSARACSPCTPAAGVGAISRTEARRTLGSTQSTSCRGCRYERRLDGARQRAEASGLPAPAAGMSEYRVGTGVDAHAFADGVPLVLGGVRLDHPRGLAGHSDGDVLAHALTD